MANKLKDMEITSSDLCRKGANPEAHIKLFKSDKTWEGGENDMEGNSLINKIAKFLAGVVNDVEGPITKAMGTAQIRETTGALQQSLESIMADDSLSTVEKHDMMAESLQQFTVEATDCMDDWAAAVEKAAPTRWQDDDPDDPNKTVRKGEINMESIDITKMSPEDQEALNALIAKYAPQETHETVHPEVQKALDEVAELRKSLELKTLEEIAHKYDIIGKSAPDLAEKLYELKKAGEQHYNDYVALLDEQVEMQQNSGIFKEFGTSRTDAPVDLNAAVAAIRKSAPELTREEAIIKAFETNPDLDPFTGRKK